MKRVIALSLLLLSCILPWCSCPCPGPNTITDETYVFQSAFRQYVPEGTGIHHALLWEFRLIFGVVDQWQWYIELTPSPEFHQWLIEDNAFGLERVVADSQFKTVSDLREPPDWFAVEVDTGKFNIYQSEDGRMRLFERIDDGRIFMTDFGTQ